MAGYILFGVAIIFTVWVSSRGQVFDRILKEDNWKWLDELDEKGKEDFLRFAVRQKLKELGCRYKIW